MCSILPLSVIIKLCFALLLHLFHTLEVPPAISDVKALERWRSKVNLRLTDHAWFTKTDLFSVFNVVFFKFLWFAACFTMDKDYFKSAAENNNFWQLWDSFPLNVVQIFIFLSGSFVIKFLILIFNLAWLSGPKYNCPLLWKAAEKSRTEYTFIRVWFIATLNIIKIFSYFYANTIFFLHRAAPTYSSKCNSHINSAVSINQKHNL